MADRSLLSGVAKELAADHRVINVDLRGFGESDEANSYTSNDFVMDLDALLSRLDLRSVSLLGWSMGGVIAQAFALEHPEAVDRLILVSSTPCLVQRPDWQAGVSPEAAAGLLELLATDWNAGADAFAGMVVNDAGQDAAREQVALIARSARPEVNITCFQTVGGEDIRPAVHSIKAPVHVMCGSEDAVCPPDASRFLAEQTSGTLAIIPGAGHAPFLTAPVKLHELVRAALS